MGTVSKALSLLGFFSRERPTIGLSDMARLSGVNKTTTYRLMVELASHGFVEQIGSGREYRLGPAFLRLSALREFTVPMRELAQSVLTSLADETGETAHFSLLQGEILSTVAYAYSTAHGTSVRMDDAEILTLHGTGSGLAVLAFSAADFVDRALAGKLQPHTEQTLTDPEKIRKLLPAIRASGIANSVSGFELDVASHAAPIFDNGANCIGAIAVAAPVTRLTEGLQNRIRESVRAHACRLTRLQGGFLPPAYPEGAPA